MDPTGGIVSYVVNKLGDLLSSEIALLGNTRQDLEWVKGELRMMQAFLEDVATMKIQVARLKIWIENVRNLAFHAEDVVDTFSRRVGIAARKSSFSSFKPQTKLKHDFGTEITHLRESVAELLKQKETYGIKIPDKSSAAGTVDQMDDLLQIRRLRSAPYVEDRDVVGLDDHVKAVKDLLARDGSKRSVVSIVGMGGLGKTTLAKKVYNNILGSSSSFECTAWVDVSQKYDIEDLLKRMAEDIMKHSGKDVGKMNQGTLKEELCQFIRFKKYLIVLDDVWTSKLWELLDDFLPDPKNGSRIITTTRNIEIAKSANPWLSPYELSPLGDIQSRDLFTKKVFPDADKPEQCCTEELASLREQILKKCGGLPLAIIVVGGLLSRKEKTPAEWRKVAEKIDWYQIEKGELCMGILALSYIDLPIHLRWCFLYLAAIPEDCVVHASLLQRLWIGEGFIEEKAGRSFEEMAETYFEELVQRCLIQVVQETTVERYIRVHDLLLELAVSEAEKIRFLDTWSALDASPGAIIRRLSFTPDRIERSSTHLPLGSNKLRSLLITNREDWQQGGNVVGRTTDLGKVKWSTIKENLKLLRVLQLSVNIDGLSEGIGDLVNLRYLAICGEWITELPESVGNLRHLQILDVGRTGVGLLPNTIWQIKTLRYLRGGQITEFPMPKDSLPDDTFNNLRALRIRGVPSMEKIFPYLTNLKELSLNIKDFSMPVLYNSIKSLERLHVLRLWATSPRGYVTVNMDEIFLPSDSHPYLHTLSLDTILVVASQLQRLPQNLKQVGLLRGNINRNIIELLGKLEHLHRLLLSQISFFEDEEDEEMVFHSGWFPQLHYLTLDGLKIKRWEMEGQSLPLLRELNISLCSRLTVLPEGLRRISTLRVFEVWGGPSQLLARLQKPEDGGREGEDWHKIKHVEDVRIS